MTGQLSMRRGAVYLTVLLAMLALLGMAALTVDFGTLVMAHQQLQAAVDAAALAGATTLQSGMDVQVATQAVIEAAAANPVLGTPLTVDPETDVQIGVWDASTRSIRPFEVSPSGEIALPGGEIAVWVRGRRTDDSPDGPIPLHFARALGKPTGSVTASSIAGLTVSRRERPPVEAVIVQDQSGSFEDEFPYARQGDSAFVEFMRDSYAENDKIGIVGFSYHPYASVPPADPLKKRDTWLHHNRPLCSNEDSAEGANATIAYINSMATVPYNAYPDRYAYTNLYTGLLMAVLQFAPPEARESAWTNFVNSLYSGGTFRNIGWWRRNNYAALRSKMAPLFTQGFANPDAEHVIVLVSDGMPWYHENSFPDSRSKDLCRYIADRAAEIGIRIHTVTLDQSDAPPDGSMGSDSEFNASLVRNGGYAFYTYDAENLAELLVGVGRVEVGQAHLIG